MSLTNSPSWMYNAGGAFYDHEIDNSLRFDGAGSSPYLSRAVTHNRKTFTVSFWLKRSSTDRRMIYGVYSNAADTAVISFENDGHMSFYDYLSGYRIEMRTNMLFRDIGAWYHVVWAIDTTQATASNRMKLYVNGEQITSFSTATYPSQNLDLKFGGGGTHAIGTEGLNVRLNFSGYFANWALVAGQQLDASYFGEFKSGIWIPKNISDLTYGTGGYLLEFAGNANDTSGNGNNFTSFNISSHDYVPDSPTNSFCTMNILDDNYSTPRFSYYQGNLRYDYGYTGAGFDRVFGTHMIVPGDTNKYYMEFTGNVTNEQMQWGVVATDSSSYTPSDRTTGITGNDGINMLRWVSYGPAPYLRIIDGNGDNAISTTNGNAANGDIFSIMYDAGTGKFYGWLNGVEFVGQSYASGTSLWKTLDTTKTYAVCMYQGDGGVSTKGGNCTANFGQDSSFAGAKTAQGNTDANGIGDFYYTVPTDALALCSANLPAPAIDPADDDTPEDYFNTVLWTGTGSGQSITGMGFQPDWLWFKSRNNSNDHALIDSVRGVNQGLVSNSTAAEVTSGASNDLVSFDSDGFTTGTPQNFSSLGSSGFTIATWGWKAGGTGASNTDGSITSTVSANPDAGFSIVTYTGNGTNSATVGHGLSSAPEFVIVKSRSNSRNWVVEHNQGKGMYLNLTNDGASAGSNTMTQQASTIRFDVSNDGNRSVNFNSETYVAYCFHSTDGFIKIGSYIGNGSSDGTFIYTGFRPAGIIGKNYNDNTTNWWFHDNERLGYNEKNYALFPNLSQAEDANVRLDILSNGFKIRNTAKHWNTSGQTFIYLAFAEQPFKYANAR